MNRREFLQSIFGLGAGIAFPISPGLASEAEIEDAWVAASRDPLILRVATWGTLSFGDEEEPGSRGEIYGIEANWTNRKELAAVIGSEWCLENIAETCGRDAVAHHNFLAEPDEQTEESDSWENWLMDADEEVVADLENKVSAWLAETPDLGAEYDWLPLMNLVTPENRAYSFFKSLDDETLDLLGVRFVEGDHPGSSYFGAELHADLDWINHLCKAEDIPMRFVSDKD